MSSVIPMADQDQDQDPDCFHNILSDPDIFILLYSCIGEYFVRSGYFYPAV